MGRGLCGEPSLAEGLGLKVNLSARCSSRSGSHTQRVSLHHPLGQVDHQPCRVVSVYLSHGLALSSMEKSVRISFQRAALGRR
jgi:hypothetical protein